MFKLTKKIILAYCSLSIIGCATLPHIQSEPIVLPKKTRSGTPILIKDNDLKLVMWWKKMHDPILNRLIAIGLTRNNQLKTAEANVQQAQAQLQEARYAWLPTLNAYGNGFIGGGWDSHVTPQGPLANSRALSNNNINFRGYFSGFTPQYTLNIWQNINNTKFYQASLAMQKANYNATKLSIISQICGAYFMLVGEKQQLQEQETYLNDLRKLKQLELNRYQNGAADLTIVTNIEQQIASNTANIVTLTNSINSIENAIQTLLNQNPAALKHNSTLYNLPTNHLVPTQLPATVLKNRPDVLMALHNVTMGQANVGIAYANLLPSISLTNLIGSASLDLKQLLNISTGLWVAQGAIKLPALNAVSWEKIKTAKSGYLAAFYNYLQTLRIALEDVDNNLTSYKHSTEAYQQQIIALRAAQKNYNLATSRYANGARDYREVLNAKLTLDTTKLNVTMAKMQQLDSIVGVYQAVAAGIG